MTENVSDEMEKRQRDQVVELILGVGKALQAADRETDVTYRYTAAGSAILAVIDGQRLTMGRIERLVDSIQTGGILHALSPATVDAEAFVLLSLLGDVQIERARQDQQWGPEHDDQHTLFDWALLLSDRASKLIEIRDDDYKAPEQKVGFAKRELVKIAAMALAAAQAVLRDNKSRERLYYKEPTLEERRAFLEPPTGTAEAMMNSAHLIGHGQPPVIYDEGPGNPGPKAWAEKQKIENGTLVGPETKPKAARKPRKAAPKRKSASTTRTRAPRQPRS